MRNWFRYQMAMFYLRKAHKVPMYTVRWLEYIQKSHQWIHKITH